MDRATCLHSLRSQAEGYTGLAQGSFTHIRLIDIIIIPVKCDIYGIITLS